LSVNGYAGSRKTASIEDEQTGHFTAAPPQF
jgi:hypothetical protein